MNLTIHHEELDATTAVIKLSGRLLLGPGCVELEQMITDLLKRGFLHLTFEVTSIAHIDSTGMGLFIDAYSKLKKLAGTVRVVGATGTVRDMFKITRLDSIFQVE